MFCLFHSKHIFDILREHILYKGVVDRLSLAPCLDNIFILEFPQMLRNCGVCYFQHFSKVADAHFSVGVQQIQDFQPLDVASCSEQVR